jgi:UDP-N-acetylglucosamine--N-acetylmuramyl-(pentapeptide) pyrophosphoryl-undecaprenol N-acetylglucosamine transferase
MFALPRAVLQARKILREFKSDVVIGVGGYASGPAMMAAILARTPTVAFEPNVVPGFANRIIARWVSEAAVQFPETGRYFKKFKVTGVPVRPAFFAIAGQRSGDPRPTLLVFGGSQGAHAINEAMVHALPSLKEKLPDLRIIHQTGERDLAETQSAYQHAGVDAEVSAFIQDMPAYFSRADVVVCRSGASTVGEIAAAGKPAIFVPFPRAADDHQKVNAQALERAGAAVLLEESQLTAARLAETITGLFQNPAKLQQMGEAARTLGHPKAAEDVARMATDLARK